MGFMVFRILQTQGVVDKVGMVFVTMCILTTSVSILFGVAIAPRAWCSFCPMGTMQRAVGGSRYQLKVNRNLCIDCGKCQKICPVDIRPDRNWSNPDCLRCLDCTRCPSIKLTTVFHGNPFGLPTQTQAASGTERIGEVHSS